jgi:hypothetical protein
MPFTPIYTQQLNDLSQEIQTALDQLFEESLTVFAEETGVKLNSELDQLLKIPFSELTESQQNQLRGENTKEQGVRQRLFLLRQAWNDITRLNKSIMDKELLTQEALNNEIELISAMFQKAIPGFAEQILFTSHELTNRKINFVRQFINIAHQLLKKQCAVQALLATNVVRGIEAYTESETLSTARKNYDEAMSAHNATWAADLKAHEDALNSLEKNKFAIEDIRLNHLLEKKKTLESAEATLNSKTENLADLEKTLKELIDKEIDDNATVVSLTQWDTELENAGKALLDAINAYKEEDVIKNMTLTQKETITFIETQNIILDRLEDAANKAFPEPPLDEKSLRTSLKKLDRLQLTLNKEINEEIQKLKDRYSELAALLTQHEADTTIAKSALNKHLPTLENEGDDTAALTNFHEACVEQHDRLTLPFETTPWKTLSNSIKTQLTAINALNKTNQGSSQSHSAASVVDTETTKQRLQDALKQTEADGLALEKKQKTLTQEQRERKKQRTASLNSGMETVKKQIQTLLNQCETINAELLAFHVTESREQALTQAINTLISVNQKRRSLIDAIRDDLTPSQNEADFLKQRLNILQKKFNENPWPVEDECHPDRLLQELGNLPINKALAKKPPFLLEKIQSDTPLEALIAKVDKLDHALRHAQKSYRYGRRGTLIGALVGGGLSAVLLGGLVASIVFSFGLSLPILIGVGVAIATAPGLLAAVGRFFGWRKDKTINNNTKNKAAKDKMEIRSNVTSTNSQHTLSRTQSIMLQKSMLEEANTDLDAYLKAAQIPKTRAPLTRRRTLIAGASLLNNLQRYPITYTSEARLPVIDPNEITTPDDDVALSYDPATVPEDNPVDTSSQKTRVRFAEETIPTESSTDENKESSLSSSSWEEKPEPAPLPATDKSTYSLFTGGDFSLFRISFASPQQAQGETSEPVVANAHRV